MYKQIPVIIVVSMGKDTRAIGNNNKLLWHASEDMKRFKALTLSKPIIMGRKTFESILSILGKPLPGRTNIVVTRQANYIAPSGVRIAATLAEAFEEAVIEEPAEIHIGGGAELYQQALPYVDKLFITWFESDLTGDTFFPEFENNFKVVNRSATQHYNDLIFEWVDYTRKL